MLSAPETNLFKTVKFLCQSREEGGIYGLKGSASAFLVALALKNNAGPILWIHSDDESASRSASDLCFYLGLDERNVNRLNFPVVHYPETLSSPYSLAGFESDIWTDRMSCLFRLLSNMTPQVITISIPSLASKIIPRSEFDSVSFTLSVGHEAERDSICANLIRAGYSRAPLVEDVGDFAARGSILDIYSPLYPNPIRIEQMGDLVESMRFFDPSSQRSLDSVYEIMVCPIQMSPPDGEALEEGLEKLVRVCEERGIEKRIRQGLLDDFRHGIRFPGAELYLPYFRRQLETFLDYLPQETLILLPDEETVSRSFQDHEQDVFHGFESAMNGGLPVPEPESLHFSKHNFQELLEFFRKVVLADFEIQKEGAPSFRIPCGSNIDIKPALLKEKAYDRAMSSLVSMMAEWRDHGSEVYIVSHTEGQAQRLVKLLEPYKANLNYQGVGFQTPSLESTRAPGIYLYVGPLTTGFRIEEIGVVTITEEEIFGPRVRAPIRKHARGVFVSSLTDLSEGEAVVHENYGIGIFRGLTRKEFDGVVGEVMVIEYAGGDILYHPVERLQSIQKFVTGSEAPPRIDRLGSKGWEKTKAKIKKSIREMAKELLEIYAQRQVSSRAPYSPSDQNFAEFEASFEFEETPDQAKAIQEVMEGLDSDRPMDRLICGDVGYGKTEIAIRAAFRVMMDGKQAAVLVPTTVLAQQHFDTFSRRFAGYPITVEMISRFRSTIEQKEILEKLEKGKVDLIVGTHRLLQKDVKFRDLGLLVLDEEQRFGVAHKERIKKYKAHVDVLTLTATPIPRTLNLSLTGIRDMSVIETPPTNRHAIRTHVLRQSDEVVREAIIKELNRGGQVFCLHNRVQTIYQRATALQRLVPEARFGVAHGQQTDNALERVMLDFVTGKINVLVCTSIIESGLDIPRSNTIIIERADTFGLADLYQLRGRVGRSNVRAYAYLLTPPETLMTADAVKRLAVIQEHSELGQGFKVAMRDMEIRGAGNILGVSQSGHVNHVGYEMYLQLLEEEVREIKGEPQETKIDPEIHLKIEAYIPDDYVPEANQRMNFYKRLSRASSQPEIDGIEEEIVDLYGITPEQVRSLLTIMGIRLVLKELRISKLDYAKGSLILTFDQSTIVSPESLIKWVQEKRKARLAPGDRLIYQIGLVDSTERAKLSLTTLRELLSLTKGQEKDQTFYTGQPWEPTVKYKLFKKKSFGLRK
ncbi:MAG: transcription-repair coupling factor [Deltaproteobacteria bacterium]|nr:transcription-repair coupling factor [Deltaproteobacteria bacterium]